MHRLGSYHCQGLLSLPQGIDQTGVGAVSGSLAPHRDRLIFSKTFAWCRLASIPRARL
jgi:hypothetical protein